MKIVVRRFFRELQARKVAAGFSLRKTIDV